MNRTKLCVDKGRENKANLNCSENDQQWRGEGVRVEGGGGAAPKHGGQRQDVPVTRGMQGRGAGEGEE